MLLAISFLILTRLDIDKAIKQFAFAGVAVVITCFVPILVAKLKVWDKLGFLYGLIGIGGLAFVCLAASTTYGAKLSISIGPVVLQPSEFIKILFIFFSACMLYKSTEFHHVVKVTILAALHVLILVASRDLGGALIYLITYLVMLYVASRKPIYMVLGLGSGALASVVAYHLFAHVRDRVIAWKDPLSVIDDQGYQISQSLFAIGSGGWFGVGLGQGMPDKIPVVKTDFVFSAIAEEFGVVFAICIIFICISCFLMFFNISMQVKDIFYKLIALGIGTLYGTQVFLALGGVTKFIPSTGVTLPLVSYGGSSLLSTIILFAIIQGLYVMQVDEGERNLMSKEELENKIATLTGGRCAEKLIFHSISTGASNDIEQATKLARAMVTKYGMSEEFGMVAFETETNAYLGGDSTLSCSPQTAKSIDDMVVAIVKNAYKNAEELLSANMDKLHKIAKYLYEQETITGEEFMKLLEEKEES